MVQETRLLQLNTYSFINIQQYSDDTTVHLENSYSTWRIVVLRCFPGYCYMVLPSASLRLRQERAFLAANKEHFNSSPKDIRNFFTVWLGIELWLLLGNFWTEIFSCLRTLYSAAGSGFPLNVQSFFFFFFLQNSIWMNSIGCLFQDNNFICLDSRFHRHIRQWVLN